MNHPRAAFAILVLTLLASAACTPTVRSVDTLEPPPEPTLPDRPERPALVVVAVFDQLRGDHLERFEDRLLPAVDEKGRAGGFAHLIDRGAYYPYAEHQVLQAMTCPGHANIATGAWPARHGIPTNTWYNRQGDKTYCVADPTSPLVGVDAKPSKGVSPRNLIAPTVGDELKNEGYPSRVVAVSVKDRGAIVMGGRRADAAVWFHSTEARWITSAFYGDLPGWIGPVNDKIAKLKGTKVTYKIEGEGSGLTSPPPEGFEWGGEVGKWETLSSPFANVVTVDAAKAAIDAMKLGQGPATDMLMVSFSGLDKVGHEHGPDSRVFEEMLLDSDRALADLLRHIQATLPDGLDRTLVAVTGDHGVSPMSAVLKPHRTESEQVDEKVLRDDLEAALIERIGSPGEARWIRKVKYFHVFLDHGVVRAKGKTLAEVRREVAAIMSEDPRFVTAFTADDVRQRTLPGGLFERQILNGYVAGRSGDVIGIGRPYHMHASAQTNHISGYTYDRMVPLIIAGAGVKQGVYAQRAEVIDLAPTLAWLMRILPPAMSEGRVLVEALDGQ